MIKLAELLNLTPPKVKSYPNLFNFWINTVKPEVKLYFQKYQGHYNFLMSQDLRNPDLYEYYQLFNLKNNPKNHYLWYLGTQENITMKNDYYSKNQVYNCSIFLSEKPSNRYYLAINNENGVFYRYFPDTNQIRYMTMESRLDIALESFKDPKQIID